MGGENSELKVCRLRQLRIRANGGMKLPHPTNCRTSAKLFKKRLLYHKARLYLESLLAFDSLRLTTYYEPASRICGAIIQNAEVLPLLPILAEERQAHDIQLPLMPTLA